ncbi:MAG: hypothetical protein LBJ31_10665 [Treponema sp.]|jgi:hypothetical protein|nr:hypothetical protein [Treponema sp.]
MKYSKIYNHHTSFIAIAPNVPAVYASPAGGSASVRLGQSRRFAGERSFLGSLRCISSLLVLLSFLIFSAIVLS